MKEMYFNGIKTEWFIDEFGNVYNKYNKIIYSSKRITNYPSIRVTETYRNIINYTQVRLDRLMYENFFNGKYDDDIPVFHIDRDEFNCEVENLHVGFMEDPNYPNEIWKKYEIKFKNKYGKVFKTIDTKYWISSYGRLYSTKYWQFIKSDNEYYYEISERSKDIYRKSISIINAIAESFIPNPFNKPYAILINKDKRIHISNITWSYYENAEDFDHSLSALDRDIEILYSGSLKEKEYMWKQVILDSIPTNYIVSRMGKVFNTKTNHLMTPSVTWNGYLRVKLSVSGHPKGGRTQAIHDLVALAFIPNPDNKPEVNHKDGRKKYNFVENLEWMTRSENIQHAIDHGWIKCNSEYKYYDPYYKQDMSMIPLAGAVTK